MEEVIKKNENKREKNIFKNWLDFYKKNLFRSHLVIYIIMVILFGVILIMSLQNSSSTTLDINNEEAVKALENINIFKDVIQEKLLIIILIVLSGFTPFMFLPVIVSPIVSYNFAVKISSIMQIEGQTYSLTLMLISAVLQLIFMALAVATGLYYTRRATKRFRYSQSKRYTINDIKQKWYELRKQEDKAKEYEEKIINERKEKEKLNVKIDYLNIGITILISILFVFLITLISIV